MPDHKRNAFIQVWPKWIVIVLGIVEIVAVLVLIATELGNVATNFWITNVFAGGWCACVMTIHFMVLFVAGCCSPGPAAAFLAVIITIIAMVACVALISFDAVFIALPSTCILTPSCASYAVSTTMFSSSFQQSFFTLFRQVGPFSSYTQSQAKFLFQIIQLSVGTLCLLLCIIYLIIYLISRNKATKVVPSVRRSVYPAPQPNYQPQQRLGHNQQVDYGNGPQASAPPATILNEIH